MQDWATQNPGRGFRLYRTPEGLRLLFTDRLYDPVADETARLFDQLGADPLYVRLTKRQECFRARLTAKPWRCSCAKPPSTFPWEDAAAEESYRLWERQYTETNNGYRACELINVFGVTVDIESVQSVVECHDRESRVESVAPLA